MDKTGVSDTVPGANGDGNIREGQTYADQAPEDPGPQLADEYHGTASTLKWALLWATGKARRLETGPLHPYDPSGTARRTWRASATTPGATVSSSA